MGDMLFTVCPWWDGPLVQQAIKTSLKGGPSGRRMDLDPSRTAGEFADQLGRFALFRRRRACDLDRAVQARHRAVGACSPVAVRAKRLLVRPARRTLGVQCRPPVRPPTGASGAGFRQRNAAFWISAAGAEVVSLDGALSAPRRRSKRRPTGSYPWVGLQIRAWRNLRRRKVDHALQQIADHRQMVALTGILLLDVGKIGRCHRKPSREQLRDQQRPARAGRAGMTPHRQ